MRTKVERKIKVKFKLTKKYLMIKKNWKRGKKELREFKRDLLQEIEEMIVEETKESMMTGEGMVMAE